MISFYALKSRSAVAFRLLGLCVFALSASNVQADLSSKQARKLITRMAGFELTNGSVRVKSISLNGAGALVFAEVRTVFKLEKDKQGNWRVAELRTGPASWEDLDLIASALKTPAVTNDCTAPDPPLRSSAASDPSAKRVRCLLGRLLGVEGPSDAVRIQEVSPLVIPLASQPSAVAVAWIRVEARLVNDNAGWKVSELRTGNRDWVRLESVVNALNEQKHLKARAELETIAKALEQFRRDRGFYVVSDKESVAIDHLSPRYLSQVIRVDPWHQPYKYQGQPDNFILSSAGPDRKDNTADDIRLANPSR